MNDPHDEERRQSPYRGLEPFDERDAAYFFGRERESKLIAASLFAAPLTLLYGPSGVGKSSVLRAGVLPSLRERRDLLPVVFPTLSVEGQGAPLVRGWQNDPLGGVKEAVAAALRACAAGDKEMARRCDEAVRSQADLPLGEFLAHCSEVSDRRLMLILDQFEEYSLYHPEDDPFAQQLPGAIMSGSLAVSFLLSLREDALARLDRFKGRIPTLWNSYRRVNHLDRAAAETAIRRPLEEYNRRHPSAAGPVDIEPPLVDAVLRDVQAERVLFDEAGSGTLGSGTAEGRIETPYLQLVMTRLWERESDDGSRRLRLATLQDEGGAAEIVRTHLDRVMAQFDPGERDMAARVFHRLVTPSGAKIAFSVSDLAEYEGVDADQLAPILRRLEEGSRRILRRVAARSSASDEPRYEIFHDRLGRAILAWRAKRLQEQARDDSRRKEAEQRRVAEESQAKVRESVRAAMDGLGAEGKAVWSRIMFYLVSTAGARLAQTAKALCELSKQAPDAVDAVLARLVDAAILRLAFTKDEAGEERRFEVSHDVVAAALLEWHSQYVMNEIGTARNVVVPLTGVDAVASAGSVAAPPSRHFPYRLVRDLLRKGAVVPFLGAGVSLSARPQDTESLRLKRPFVPSNRELKEILARACDFPAAEFEASDIAEVASFYVHRLGRAALDETLEQTLGRPDYEPSATHRLFADWARAGPLLVLTTNYDTLMERAFDEAQVPYDVLAYVTAQERRGAMLAYVPHGSSSPVLSTLAEVPLANDRNLIVRLHGPATGKDYRTGSYVLTEEDQIDWLVGLRTHGTALPPPIAERLQAGHLLSLGHSARDWSQRALLHTLHGHGRRTKAAWSVALNPAPMSIMTWQRYGVDVFGIELNEWALRMRDADPPA